MSNIHTPVRYLQVLLNERPSSRIQSPKPCPEPPLTFRPRHLTAAMLALGPHCDRGATESKLPRLVTLPMTRRVAAFFDLDKTIIAKSSTLAFSKPFFDQGLINRRSVLKTSYAQFLFLLSGADHDQMERMRAYLTSMCAGWNVEQVRSMVAETLHDIVDPLVFAEAADLIADHKLRGHDVIVVSASGEEIVAPIADALGATQHGHPHGGRGRAIHRRGGVLLLRRRQSGGDPGTRGRE